jgi:hypothetical protein
MQFNCYLTRSFRIFLLTLICPASMLQAQTTGYSGTGANIDVTYQRCEWRINPDSASKGIKGTVTTYFLTKTASVSSISLDLNKTSFNNANLSVYYHGSPVTFSFPTSGNLHVLTMNLPVTLTINTFDSITINYNGAPPAVSGQAEGYQKKTSAGSNYIYTLSESYEDRDWWPCKADMQDKIDSMDFYINVPNSFTAVTQGRLIDSTITGANQVFHWKSNIPVASYLVSVGVAKYRVYDRGTVNINGTNVPVWYFIFPGKSAATYTSMLSYMDNSKAELTQFSNYFGDYPFKTEKHGYYEFGWGGGMEHQSISAMSAGSMIDWGVIAHELAHQWFGDKVTFGTWNHLWLAEGFARYSESLAAELVPALGQNAAAERYNYKNTATDATNMAYGCYIPNGTITNSTTLWNSAYGTTVYERGAMVVSMLRTLLGSDKFSQACKNYLNDPALAYRSATTDDLRIHMQNAAGGYDLTPFFNSYVYGNGFPSYNANIGWAKSGTNRITLQVTSQTKSAGSTVAYYYTPIAIRVRGSLVSQDTVIVIYDQNGQLSRAGDGISAPVAGNIISFNLNFNPVTVTFDPFNQTMAYGSTAINSVLDVKLIDFVLQQQPAGNQLQVTLSDGDNELREVILQRSLDGVTYLDAGSMTEIPSSGLIKKYSYTDNTPYLPSTFYRVKIVTPENVQYSKTLKATHDLLTGVTAYPNPASKELYVRWTGTNGQPATIKLTGMDGKPVFTQTSAEQYLMIPVEGLPAGTYLLQVKEGNLLLVNRKIVVRK